MCTTLASPPSSIESPGRSGSRRSGSRTPSRVDPAVGSAVCASMPLRIRYRTKSSVPLSGSQRRRAFSISPSSIQTGAATLFQPAGESYVIRVQMRHDDPCQVTLQVQANLCCASLPRLAGWRIVEAGVYDRPPVAVLYEVRRDELQEKAQAA